MSYRIDFAKQALKDIDFHKKSGDKATIKKLFTLLERTYRTSIHWHWQTRSFKTSTLRTVVS